MRKPPRILSVLLLAVLVLAACGVDPESAPTFTPDPGLRATAAVLFPTPVPTIAPTPTAVARADAGEEIARLLDDMQIAVITRNGDDYRVLIDTSDPLFALEHRRWVESWQRVGVAVTRFEMTVRNLVVEGDSATGDLSLLWSARLPGEITRGADYPVRFTRGADGRWLYAGELLLPIDADGSRVWVQSGLEGVGQIVAALLPGVYAHVTESLGHVPSVEVGAIKLYDNPWSLLATVSLGIGGQIDRWNAPGEAIKLLAEGLIDETLLARELTFQVLFDLAGDDAPGQISWWAAEGAAQVVASRYWTFTDRNRTLRQAQDWQATTGLAAWDEISDAAAVPDSLAGYVPVQGYAIMRYITETYGQEARNTWLRALIDTPLEAATTAVFAIPFAELSEGFLAWLAAQE